jgi:sugar phosphate isomerase/epimerase
MQIGMSSLACPKWTVEQVAEAARDYGYAGVELRILDGETVTSASIEANLRRLKAVFGPGQVALAGLGSSVRFTAADAAERTRQEAELSKLIEQARELGAPIVRVFGGRIAEGDPLDTAIGRVSESLSRCAPLAAHAGVTLALETHDDFSRSANVARALAGVESPAVGALWDTHHPYRMGESLAEVWLNLASRLVHVHLKDARKRSDGDWDLVLLGDGEVPNREILRALAMRSFAGWVVVEWEKAWHPGIADPEIALPQHLAKMREWLTE